MKMTIQNRLHRNCANILFASLCIAMTSTSADAAPLAVGGSFGGGKIAYILKPGDKGYDSKVQHGLVADTADLSGVYDWPDALAAAERLKKNGYSDWYLPDRNELDKLYAKKSAIGGFAKNPKKEIFYWSSSEKDPDYSWGQGFKTGKQYTTDKMSKTGHVRAVRPF
ncbi:MAG: DUF1566 domain-containing protein [Chlorobium sp.]|nr:MAG: DUF1566 domain-containing protein [Chlorobium sp.]